MKDERVIIFAIGLVIRIIGAIYCVGKAKKLNRNYGSWGVFGFLTPILAMIWIQFMKPLIVWDKTQK